MTSTISYSIFNSTSFDDLDLVYTIEPAARPNTSIFTFLKWLIRIVCIVLFGVCPWANYQLIQMFQNRPYHKQSSVKWYILFKATFDVFYMLVSIPIIFSLTFNVDLIHRSMFTCKVLTYIHYLSDDLISIMLSLACVDRMCRITCAYRLRVRISLIVSIAVTSFFTLWNIHHVVRLKIEDDVCQRSHYLILESDFDIYYSYIYTAVTWTIIFIASINLAISLYCDRLHRLSETKNKEQQQRGKTQTERTNHLEPDRIGLIYSMDDFDDSQVITIEESMKQDKNEEPEKQDNADYQISVCVLITALLFLFCNLPNFIIFVLRFVYHQPFSIGGLMIVYLSIFPLLFSHTMPYFIFKHLAARLFSDQTV